MSEEDAQKILDDLNISKAQLPKVLVNDAGIPEGCIPGDIIKIERREDDEVHLYFRVVVK
jgi:DNA-directed RNA polymerase subunit H (RpoH/RPB5)